MVAMEKDDRLLCIYMGVMRSRQATGTDAAPFVAAGYVLMMPTLRGENGNPGS